MTLDVEVQEVFGNLLRSCQTLQLATISPTDEAEASYAPYLYADGNYYIFISELASHTQNILSNPCVGLLLIESEAEARNPFARKRFSAQCRVTEITSNAANYQSTLDQLERRFGSTIGMLRTLPDFHLLQLQPIEGRLVIGFGKAFELHAAQLSDLPKQS